MAEFIYSTSLSIDRPWLIDVNHLQSLDALLEEEAARLSKRNRERLNTEIEEQLSHDIKLELARMREDRIKLKSEAGIGDKNSEPALDLDEVKQRRREEIKTQLLSHPYSDYAENRSITIHLEKNKRVVVKSFAEALRQQSLSDEMPVGFDDVLRSGEIKCEIELRKSGTLDISVSPEHLAESRELFAALQRWAQPIRPPKWQRFWASINPLQWMLLLFAISVSALAIGDSTDSAKRFYKEQAVHLLKDGVSQDEQLKAIEMILALETGFVPPSQSTPVPGWFWFLLCGGFVVCLVLSFPPKSIIGVGKGQEAINHWRIWMRIVFIIVPSFIFLNIIWPYLSTLISNRL
jgi:hypothetical protein